MYTHPMYVCERCGWGHYHPLSYCYKCPGKLVRKDVPHLPNPKSIEQSRAFLLEHGVKYTGEYYEAATEREKLNAQLLRYREKLDIAIAENHTDARKKIWLDSIRETLEKLTKLNEKE